MKSIIRSLFPVLIVGVAASGSACDEFAMPVEPANVADAVAAVSMPDAPSSLAATVIGPTQIDLEWPVVTGATQYAVGRRTRIDGSWGPWVTVATVPASTAAGMVSTKAFSDTELKGGITYRHRVTACVAECSDPTLGPIRTTPLGAPDAPASLESTVASSSRIDLQWPGVPGSTAYQLGRRTRTDTGWGAWEPIDMGPASTPGEDIATQPGEAASAQAFSDTGLTGGLTYRYRVRACTGTDCSDWTLSAIRTTPLPAPASLSATAVSPTRIDLEWPSVPAAGTYRIWRRTNDGEGWSRWALVADQPASAPAGTANVSTYSDTGLTGGFTYRHRVAACADECSDPTLGPIRTTPLGAPDAPASLSATVVSPTRIDLEWPSVPAAATYRIWRRTNDGEGWDSWALVADEPASAPAGTASVSTYSDTGLTGGFTYRHRVQACTSVCSESVLGPIRATPVPAPPEPGSLRVGTALGNWNDGSPAIVVYASNAAEGWARQRLVRDPSEDWRDDVTVRNGLNVLAFETDGAAGFIRWNPVVQPRLLIIMHGGGTGKDFLDGRRPNGNLDPEWAQFLARHPDVMIVSMRWRDAGIPGPDAGRYTRRDNSPTNIAEMAHRRPVRVFRWIVENLVPPSTPIALLGHSAGSDAILSALDAREPWLGRVRYFAPISPSQGYDLVASCNQQTPPGTYINPRTGERGHAGAAANLRSDLYGLLPDYLQMLPPTCAVGTMTEALAAPSNFRDRLPTTGALHPDAVVRFAVGDRNNVDTKDGFTWTSGQLYHHPYFATYRKEWFWTDEVPHGGLWRRGTQAVASHLASIEAALLP